MDTSYDPNPFEVIQNCPTMLTAQREDKKFVSFKQIMNTHRMPDTDENEDINIDNSPENSNSEQYPAQVYNNS